MAFWFSLCDTNYFTFNLMWRFLIRYCLSRIEQRVESDSSDFPKQTKSQTSTSCEDAGSQNIDKGLKKQKDALRSCFWLNSQEESYWEPIEFERLRIGDRRHTEQVSRLTPIHWWCQSQWTVISGVMQSAQIEGLITKQIRPPMAAPLKGACWRFWLACLDVVTSAFYNSQRPTSWELRGGRQLYQIFLPQSNSWVRSTRDTIKEETII